MNPTLNHILCVDDEEDILQVARLSLEAVGGFKVSLCHGSTDAVAKARELKPDLVLLDVMMPVMDGPTTLAHLHAADGCADVPVIFMTAKARPDELSALLELGALGVISKPFDPMTLASEVRSIWSSRHEHA